MSVEYLEDENSPLELQLTPKKQDRYDMIVHLKKLVQKQSIKITKLEQILYRYRKQFMNDQSWLKLECNGYLCGSQDVRRSDSQTEDKDLLQKLITQQIGSKQGNNYGNYIDEFRQNGGMKYQTEYNKLKKQVWEINQSKKIMENTLRVLRRENQNLIDKINQYKEENQNIRKEMLKIKEGTDDQLRLQINNLRQKLGVSESNIRKVMQSYQESLNSSQRLEDQLLKQIMASKQKPLV